MLTKLYVSYWTIVVKLRVILKEASLDHYHKKLFNELSIVNEKVGFVINELTNLYQLFSNI